MKKFRKVIFYLIKYSPFIIGFICLLNFNKTLEIIDNILNGILNFYKENTLKENVIYTIFFLGLYKLMESVVKKLYYREKAQQETLVKNTFSKGNSRFLTEDEKEKLFFAQDYENIHEIGFILTRYKEYRIPIIGKKIRRAFFKDDKDHSKLREQNEIKEKYKDKEIQEMELKHYKKTKPGIDLIDKILMFLCGGLIDVVIVDGEPIHILIIGTTRSGKTQTFLLPMLDFFSKVKDYKKKPNVVLTDPKGEIFAFTSKMMENRGYDIKVLNFTETNFSNSYNPLEVVNFKHLELIKKHNEKMNNVYESDIYINEQEGIITEEDKGNKLLYRKGEGKRELVEKEKIEELKTKLYNTINSSSTIKEENKIQIIDILKSQKGNLFPEEKVIKEVEERELIPEELKERKEEKIITLKIFNQLLKKYNDDIENMFFKEMNKIEWSKAEQEIKDLATILIPKSGHDPFWSLSAQSLYATYIKYVWEKSYMNDSVYRTYNVYSIGAELTRMSEDGSKGKTKMALELEKRPKNHFMNMNHPKDKDGKTYDSIDQSVRAELSTFYDGSIGVMASKNEFNFEIIHKGDKPTIIYLITPDYKTTYNNFVTMFIDQFYISGVEYADSLKTRKLPRKTFFLLDEFANIPEIRDFNTKLTVSLGRGIQFALIVQNTAQLEEVYGSEGYKTILDNTHNKTYLLAGENDTREWFSTQVGNTTILNKNISTTSEGELNVSYSEESKALVTTTTLNKNPMGISYVANTKTDPMKNMLRPAFQFMECYKDKSLIQEPSEFFEDSKHNNLHSKLRGEDIVF